MNNTLRHAQNLWETVIAAVAEDHPTAADVLAGSYPADISERYLLVAFPDERMLRRAGRTECRELLEQAAREVLREPWVIVPALDGEVNDPEYQFGRIVEVEFQGMIHRAITICSSPRRSKGACADVSLSLQI